MRMTTELWIAFALLFFGGLALGTSESSAQDLPADDVAGTAEPRVDQAVQRALEYLAAQQEDDGAWVSGKYGRMTSITSLGVMAFLAAGHTPDAPGPYRETIERGIRYVLSQQREAGLLVSQTTYGPMYCHGISTLMLAEVVGMVEDPELASEVRIALARAVDLILAAQDYPGKRAEDIGGWRYRPTSQDSDISVSGWQILALRAARDVGCDVPAESITKALAFIKRCATESGGFVYQPGQGATNNPRTGIGILALEIGQGHLSDEAVAGGDYLVENGPIWSSQHFFYEVYYCSLATFRLGGRTYRSYYPRLIRILLERQDRDGSWLSGDSNDQIGGRNYCTAMAVLALAVEYRYLPIYQK